MYVLALVPEPVRRESGVQAKPPSTCVIRKVGANFDNSLPANVTTQSNASRLHNSTPISPSRR